LNNQDIHINIAGGLKVREPAIDLGVSLAIVSAFKNRPIGQDYAVFGEVGLAGGNQECCFYREKDTRVFKNGIY